MNTLWNGTYYRKHATIQVGNALHVLKDYKVKRDAVILDVGCGTGNITKELANRAYDGQVIGIDSSIQMLQCAWEEYREVPNLQFVHQCAESFDLGVRFDLITSFSALHFISDHVQLLEHFKSHLNPGGELLFLLASKMNSTASTVLKSEPWSSIVQVEKRIHYKTLDEYHELLNGAGFSKKRIVQLPIVHSFTNREELIQFLMTYLPYASGLSEENTLELATEIADSYCREQGRCTEVKMKNTLLLVEAFLP